MSGREIVPESGRRPEGKPITASLFYKNVKASELFPVLAKVYKVRFEGVEKVEVSENTLKVNTSSDIRSKISKAVVNNDVSLVQMKVHEFSLDEIYMKYFKEN